MRLERILFPTDFSEGSDEAMRYAAALAKDYQAILYVLYVIPEIIGANWYIPHPSVQEIYQDLEVRGKAEMEKYVRRIQGPERVEPLILRGTPYQRILEVARDKKVDLIVMGTHGRTGVDHLIFGSTAERVVREAPCPVFTVRIPEHRR